MQELLKNDNIHSGPICFEQTTVSWGGGVGGPGHYVVTPTRVEVELKLSWAVPISHLLHFYSGAKLAKFGTKTGPGIHDTKTIALYINVLYFEFSL